MSAILVPISEEKRKKFFIIQSFVSTPVTFSDSEVFTDYSTANFPVLEGTPYAYDLCTMEPSWVEYLYKHAAHFGENYDDRCQQLIDNLPKKENFRDHSLFLIKESLKTFSPYSKKARKLLKLLNKL